MLLGRRDVVLDDPAGARCIRQDHLPPDVAFRLDRAAGDGELVTGVHDGDRIARRARVRPDVYAVFRHDDRVTTGKRSAGFLVGRFLRLGFFIGWLVGHVVGSSRIGRRLGGHARGLLRRRGRIADADGVALGAVLFPDLGRLVRRGRGALTDEANTIIFRVGRLGRVPDQHRGPVPQETEQEEDTDDGKRDAKVIGPVPLFRLVLGDTGLPASLAAAGRANRAGGAGTTAWFLFRILVVHGGLIGEILVVEIVIVVTAPAAVPGAGEHHVPAAGACHPESRAGRRRLEEFQW